MQWSQCLITLGRALTIRVALRLNTSLFAPHCHASSPTPQTQKSHPMGGFLTNLMSGSSLLSHGETPHYHRRYGVSLLSSAWGQVGPPRYCRQTNSVCSRLAHFVTKPELQS